MNGFNIPHKLPSLNEYQFACRSHWAVGAKMKKDAQRQICACIHRATAKGDLYPVECPCVVHFVWYEKTKRRDADNIASAKKYILDAMQETGILPNDNRKYVKGFTDKIVDADFDGVRVEIEELKE